MPDRTISTESLAARAAEEHFGRTQDQFAKCIESRAS